jgi:hypothetical protein
VRANGLLKELLDLFEPSRATPDSHALHEITFVIAPVVLRSMLQERLPMTPLAIRTRPAISSFS